MAENRALYAKHATSVEIGTPAELLATASGGKWVPTIVNPAPAGGRVALAFFYTHLLTWVVALALSCTVNFGAASFMGNGTNATGAYETAYGGTNAASTTTQTIGILGGIATVGGVGCLLVGAALFDVEAYGKTVWLNALVQFLTLFGSTATLYIFAEAGVAAHTVFFWLALFALLFQGFGQVMLYATSSSVPVTALPRIFVASLTASVQFISALAISSGDFVPTATDNQKIIAWMVPILTFVGMLIMVGARRMLGQPSSLVDRPFVRSLVILPFTASALLSVYKLSFVKSDAEPTSYMFALVGLLLNWMIMARVLEPSGDYFGA